VELAEELFGVRLCAGTVEAILQRAGQALAEPYEQLGQRVCASECLNMDETGWRTAGERRALWGMFTGRHAFFHLATDRHEDHAKRLLKGHQGIVTSDRQYKPIIHGYATKQARNRYCRGMARNLLKAWPALWTFATHDGVQPTNNHAERSLRGAVIYRKLSLGSQSEQGERRIERLLSASITCRLQHKSLFAYLTELLAAHARGEPLPSLT
jgi:Transposase IS66 family